MTSDEFRRLALALPAAEEKSHMSHPDFRVDGSIFATLSDAESAMGMVKLTPAQQAAFLTEAPAVYRPAAGAWGRGGSTMVRLVAASEESVARALSLAWRNSAPKRLAAQHPAV